MSGEQRQLEAHWRLTGGPLMEKSILMELFGAIGMVKEIAPRAYDMNRRGKWRAYSGPRMVVDALTQRTQLMEIAEADALEEGGSQVVIEMGKQGRAPSASLRWRTGWPPTSEERGRWEQAVEGAFRALPLESMVIVGSRGEGEKKEGRPPVWLGALDRRQGQDVEALVEASQGDGQPMATENMVGRSFWGQEEDIPSTWSDWWAERGV